MGGQRKTSPSGTLLGKKMVLNEFVVYQDLGTKLQKPTVPG
jgi:nucleoside permease NupC